MSSLVQKLRRDERGVSLIELMVGMATFLVVFGAILTMVQAAMHNQDRVARQVVANQKARPILTRIIDRLHSSCIAPGIAPIQAGSTNNTLIFMGRFGRTVLPTPERTIVSYNPANHRLTQSVQLANSGQAPTWGYPAPPANPPVLLEGVSQGRYGNPSVTVPVFRYYAYNGGVVSTTPLPIGPTGLSAADAARTVQVDIAFAVSSGTEPAQDVKDRITLTDSTTLRLEPASEDSAEVNLPCV